MYFVYILRSEIASKSYVGMSDNLVRRLRQHNLGSSFYTRQYKPWKLIFKEQFDTREEARRREKYFKSAAGRRFLRKFVFKN